MQIDFSKTNGLVPVIIQDFRSNEVLMLGYMNQEALTKSIAENRVTFYSRSKKRLWTKGETSGNFLNIKNIAVDCDNDTILIQAIPQGPTCHLGTSNCFGLHSPKGFLYKLESTIHQKIDQNDPDSYTNDLYKRGINKVIQKVGEEAVELVIEAKDDNIDLFKNEAADLLYHFLILLKAKAVNLTDIESVLLSRDKKLE